ncbi:MAG: radical SAM protein [Rikenellaceae bacterium]
MATALYHDIIFGPIHSRRLGLSLGVNLLPLDNKLCSFECVYCECGWTKDLHGKGFNSREDVARILEEKLCSMVQEGLIPNVITFAGNGEPTMHPQFEQIIDDTIEIRDRIVPTAKISVLSNATMIGKQSVRAALKRVDNNILKLDSAIDTTVQLMDRPRGNYSVARQIELMKMFEGKFILQTMFLRGNIEGRRVDNTSEVEVGAWLEAVKQIKPSKVMVYTIDRDTPLETLEKVTIEELKLIAAQLEALGIECSVAG